MNILTTTTTFLTSISTANSIFVTLLLIVLSLLFYYYWFIIRYDQLLASEFAKQQLKYVKIVRPYSHYSFYWLSFRNSLLNFFTNNNNSNNNNNNNNNNNRQQQQELQRRQRQQQNRIEVVKDAVIKREGPVFGFNMLNKKTIMVADADMIQSVLIRDFTKAPNRRIFPVTNKIFHENVAMASDEQWKRLRAISTPAFSVGRLKRMKLYIDETVQTMIKNMNTKINTER